MKKLWYSSELPKGFYSADVTKWGDMHCFRAYPVSGDTCIEGIFPSENDACKCGEDFAGGRISDLTKRLCSVSY